MLLQVAMQDIGQLTYLASRPAARMTEIQRREPGSPASVARVATAEVDITADLVRDLLRDQHPDLAAGA
jgi:hypothetical protein